MEQTGRDSALPEGTNYQDFISKTNILQSNHILHSLLHCSVCVCVYRISDNDLDQLSWKRLDQFPRHYSRAVAAHIYFFNFF